MEKWYSSTAALSFGLFFIIVGIPIWWQTTTVYRAELPYSDIKQAFQKSPNLRIDIEVIASSNHFDPIAIAKLGEMLQDTFSNMNSRSDYIAMNYRGFLKVASKVESDLLSAVSSTSDLDEFPHSSDEERYSVYIMPLKSVGNLKLPFINNHRQIFLPSPPDATKLMEVVSTLETICAEIFRPAALSRTFQVVHGAPLNDKELLRSQRFDSSYTIVFSLLVPEPDSVLASWDMSTAIREYLSDFEETLLKHVDLRIKSQVLFYETLAIKPKREKNMEYNYLTPADMPHLINPIEARLGSFVDTNPTLNFLIYIPTAKEYPLHLHDEKGEKLLSNSFLVPRWGGFYIHNVNTTSTSHPILHQVDMGPVFTQLLPQIKGLLGFANLPVNTVLHRSPVRDSSLSQWEMDQWMKQRTIENIGTSTHALYSLSNLVQNIRNMVINDDISEQVKTSVSSIMESYQHLSKGAIRQAFIASKNALKSADKAFFDTSLLELLYFPEDQKFAIYIPLFLPIALPILKSTIVAIKWFKGKTENSTEKDQTTKPKSD